MANMFFRQKEAEQQKQNEKKQEAFQRERSKPQNEAEMSAENIIDRQM